MALRRRDSPPASYGSPSFSTSGSPPPYEHHHGQTHYYNRRSFEDLPAMDNGSRRSQYYDINEPNDRAFVDAQDGPTHYYNGRSLEDLPDMDYSSRRFQYYDINEPYDRASVDAQDGPTHYYNHAEQERFRSMNDEYPFDDLPYPQRRHDAGLDRDSLRDRYEPSRHNYAPLIHQSSPCYDPVDLLDDYCPTCEAIYASELEYRSFGDNTTNTRSCPRASQAGHARYIRFLRLVELPYFDRIEVNEERRQAREAYFARIHSAPRYGDRMGVDPSRVGLDPVEGSAFRRQRRERRRRRA